VEDGLERRSKYCLSIVGFELLLCFTYKIYFIVLHAGHVVHLHDPHGNVVGHHTLGHPIGNPGSTARVHSVVGRPDLVAKVFHGGAPLDHRQEAINLHAVGEFHGAENSAGHHVIFATRHHGRTLPQTDLYRNANPADRANIRAQAAHLATGRNQIHAHFHEIVHTYVVLFIYVFNPRISFLILGILIMKMSSTQSIKACLPVPTLWIGVVRDL
jgi:hypothetical protein